MAPQLRGTSRRRWSARPWRRRRSRSTLVVALLPLALVMALPAAPVLAQAAPAITVAALLPSLPVQSPASPPPTNCLLGLIGCGTTPQTSGLCVVGLLLCGGNVVGQPGAGCVVGLLCNQAPAPCVAGLVLCEGSIVGPGDHPSPGGSPSRSGGGGASARPAPGGTATQAPGRSNVALALGLPPGVSPIPASAAQGNGSPRPDGVSELLSLSIRDGLSPGDSQLWPALAILQAVLLLVIVGGFAARRVLEASEPPQG